MGAQDHLSQVQFFHRSHHSFQPGDTVDPAYGSDNHVYATSTPGGGIPMYGDKVYEVQPQGKMKADPHSTMGFRSKKPFTVVRSVPPEEEHDDKYYTEAYEDAEGDRHAQAWLDTPKSERRY